MREGVGERLVTTFHYSHYYGYYDQHTIGISLHVHVHVYVHMYSIYNMY